VPDEARGERLVVLYVDQNLAQYGLEVRPWCQQLGGRGLPNLWLPSERDFFAVAEIPILPSGKMDLKRVKALALELASKGYRREAPPRPQRKFGGPCPVCPPFGVIPIGGPPLPPLATGRETGSAPLHPPVNRHTAGHGLRRVHPARDGHSRAR